MVTLQQAIQFFFILTIKFKKWCPVINYVFFIVFILAEIEMKQIVFIFLLLCADCRYGITGVVMTILWRRTMGRIVEEGYCIVNRICWEKRKFSEILMIENIWSFKFPDTSCLFLMDFIYSVRRTTLKKTRLREYGINFSLTFAV